MSGLFFGPIMKESQIERAVSSYSLAAGYRSYKFTSPGHRFVPDRMFIYRTGDVCFMEFKAPGGKVSAGQKREIGRLGLTNKVAVIWDVEYGKQLLDDWAAQFEAPPVAGHWWVVYPRSDKFDLPLRGKNHIAGIFNTEEHAIEYCKRNWPHTGEVYQGTFQLPEECG